MIDITQGKDGWVDCTHFYLKIDKTPHRRLLWKLEMKMKMRTVVKDEKT